MMKVDALSLENRNILFKEVMEVAQQSRNKFWWEGGHASRNLIRIKYQLHVYTFINAGFNYWKTGVDKDFRRNLI